MPAIKCKCGNKISYGEIPSYNELLIISDVDFDKYEGKIDAEELYKNMKSVLHCNKCNRWWFFKDGFDNKPICYIREDD
jgi:hypothetical protein